MLSFLYNFIFYLGVLYFVKHLFEIFTDYYVHFIRKLFIVEDLRQRFGTWAVVTGGSDGLGECYCRELASRGLNIVLISEKLPRLKSVAKELESEFKIQTKYIHADLRGGEQVYAEIERQIKDLDIGILVNNAGVLVPYPMAVEEMSHDQVMNHVLVNIAAPTLMCKIVLPSMKERGRGAIVNLSSITSLRGSPFVSVYAASKAYMQNISEALQFECRGHDIQVQSLMPSFVKTNLISFSSILSNYVASDAQTFVRSAVDTIGVTNYTAGYFPHDAQHYIIRTGPRCIYVYLSGLFSSYCRSQYVQQETKSE